MFWLRACSQGRLLPTDSKCYNKQKCFKKRYFLKGLICYTLCLGDALDYLLKNIFTEAAGARKGFPKIAMIITDGKSQDPVEEYAKRLRNIGVEIFALGTALS